MNQAQEILLDLLTALREFEGAEESDTVADAEAIKATFKATLELTQLGYRKGADGEYRRR